MVNTRQMKSIWSGSISFGLVNIPVKLYSAAESKNIDFDMLHKKDFSPIRYARVCKAEGKEVPYIEIVKGYEYQKGDYVVLSDEDFKKADVRKTKTIDIINFAREDEIDAIYFEKPYFLEPQKGSEKAYSLLRSALEKSKKVGIAKFVLRSREHLGVVKPDSEVIILDQIRFSDEVRSAKDLKIFNAKIEDREIDMALALIDQLTTSFNINDYKDTYRQDLEKIINEKVKGKVPKPRGEEPQPTNVKDLMSVLKESLQKEKERRQIAAVR